MLSKRQAMKIARAALALEQAKTLVGHAHAMLQEARMIEAATSLDERLSAAVAQLQLARRAVDKMELEELHEGEQR